MVLVKFHCAIETGRKWKERLNTFQNNQSLNRNILHLSNISLFTSNDPIRLFLIVYRFFHRSLQLRLCYFYFLPILISQCQRYQFSKHCWLSSIVSHLRFTLFLTVTMHEYSPRYSSNLEEFLTRFTRNFPPLNNERVVNSYR